MKWQARIKKRQCLVSKSDWDALVLASARCVLQAFNASKERKEQLPLVSLLPDTPIADVGHAVALRSAKRDREELLAWARLRMPTDEAERLFDAATTACEMDVADVKAVCCMKGTFAKEDIKRVTLHGNVGEHGIAMRRESSYNVDEGWLDWVRACMLVGNLTEALDQQVGMQVRDKRTLDGAGVLALQRRLRPLRKCVKHACIVLYRGLANRRRR